MMSGVCGMKAEACEMKRPGKDAPIGVFDSGVGGISVLRKMISLMPNENYIYYGDSANAPYGDRSDEEVLSLTENVFDYLLSEGVKGIVVACNTATSVAVRRLRGRYPDLPIVGIEPAIKPAAKNHEGGSNRCDGYLCDAEAAEVCPSDGKFPAECGDHFHGVSEHRGFCGEG